MNFSIFCVVFLIFNFYYAARGASILALFSTLSYSDHLVYRGYVEQLARRGHHVILMTPYPGHFRYPEVERIVELDVSPASARFWSEYKKLLTNVDDYYPSMRQMNELSIKIAVAQLKSQQMMALFINPNIKFDLVITEADMPILYAVAEKYRAPHVSITASTGKINMYESKGNPNHPLLYPDVNTLNYGNLSIRQKLEETRRYLFFKYEYYYYHLPLCQMAAEKIFDLKRDLLEVEEDIDMLFITGNQMLIGNRPTVPAIIYLDNLHIKPDQKLPQHLQNLLDTSERGCIYFSLGTIQDSEHLSRRTIQMLMDAFSELPFTVLFKIGNITMINKPDNVITNVWFPQQQILAHPNLKVFVTHGGARSLEEAVFYGVPIVGLPIVLSRKVFISQITKYGSGEIVDPYVMDKAVIMKTVLDVATKERYKKAMLQLKELFFNSIISGPERAVWYTEYVLRHGGARHLRSPLAGIPFYKFFMLDILGYLFAIIFVSLFATYLTVRRIIKRLRLRFGALKGSKEKFKSL